MTLKYCPVCRNDIENGSREVPYPANNTNENAPKKIHFCNHCQVGIAAPTITDQVIAKLYKGSEYWKVDSLKITKKSCPVPFALAKARWELISDNFEKRSEISILDIGAGYGCLGLVASELESSKIEYSIVEPDMALHAPLSIAWKQSNDLKSLRIFHELSEVNRKYDIVALSQVLEHVSEPVALVEKALGLVNANGFIFIDVPNQDHLFKADVFPHLLFFSPESIRSLIGNSFSNLKIICLSTWGRSREKSTLSTESLPLLRTSAKIVKKLKRLLSGELVTSYYSWHFGANAQCSTGMWIRMIAQKMNES
jgi:2-polyprenyl-3-methyl-5-hydroxy-6-metoxy-1,4-benzoquinol methylase